MRKRSKENITKVFTAKGEVRFRVEWRDVEGKKYRKHLKTRTTAREYLSYRRSEVFKQKHFGLQANPKILIDDFVKLYIKQHLSQQSEGHCYRETRKIKTVILSFFNGYYLHNIKPETIEEFKNKRLTVDKVKKGTVDKELSLFHTIFKKAIQWGKYVGKNPLKQVSKFNIDNTRSGWFDDKRYKLLFAELPEHVKPIAELIKNTGLRTTECLNLKWETVDFKNRVIILEGINTKNKKINHVYLNNTALEVLKEQWEIHKKNKDIPYVFFNPKTRNKYTTVHKAFRHALRRAGFPAKKYRLYDLRHTTGTELAINKIDPYVLQRIMRHKSFKTTRRYIHIADSLMKEAVKILDKKKKNRREK
jgi:integrase